MIQSLELFDRFLLLSINGFHLPWLDQVMWQLSESWHTYLFVFVFAFYFYKKFDLKKAVELLVGIAIVIACCDLSANVVKHAVKRYRPSHNTEIQDKIITVNNYRGGTYGFFSSHAANSFGITAFVYFCLFGKPKKYRLLLFLYPALIVYSRMYLGVHYPSDILVGMMAGLFFGRLIFGLMNRHFFKFNEKNTPA